MVEVVISSFKTTMNFKTWVLRNGGGQNFVITSFNVAFGEHNTEHCISATFILRVTLVEGA